MCTQLWYEDNPIPLFPAIYKMVQDKAFGWDDDTHSVAGAMKGLSPYMMVEGTASEIEEENQLQSTPLSTMMKMTDVECRIKEVP